ncbi:MAG TPA: C4-dicarboxylate TRAP transporter substrate-binding protein [Usitatibacter sp.]|nr:C4-dicarboxylate TRAP transporter substrate-binding protein [Usitatibacter sp.]
MPMPMKSLLAAALAAFALAFGACAAEPQFRIKYASASPPGSQTSVPIVWWAEQVEKRSNGRVKIEFFWSGSLIKGPDILGAVGKGIVPMGKIYTVDYTGQMPLHQLVNLPFTTQDVYVIQRATAEMLAKYPAFQKEFDKQNLVRLGGLATGTVHLLSKKPIKSLEDLKGLSIRARGPQAQVLKSVGAVPVSVAFGELYEALDRGVIGSTIMYELSVMPYKFNEIAGNFTYVGTGLGHAIQAEIMNKDYFEALPKDVQKLLKDTMADAEIWYAQTFEEKNRKETAQMKAGDGTAKVAFFSLPDKDVQHWHTVSQSVYEEWANENRKFGNTQEMVKTFRGLLAKYEAEVKSSGYPKFVSK